MQELEVLYYLRTIAENFPVPFEGATRKDVEKFMRWLNGKDCSPHTFSDFGMILKRFLKFVRYDNVNRDTPFPEECGGFTAPSSPVTPSLRSS